MKNKMKQWRKEAYMWNKINGYKNSGRANKPQYVKAKPAASNLLKWLVQGLEKNTLDSSLEK